MSDPCQQSKGFVQTYETRQISICPAKITDANFILNIISTKYNNDYDFYCYDNTIAANNSHMLHSKRYNN